MMATPGTITAGSRVARRQLGRRLKQLRTKAGMSLDDVRRAKFGSTSKVSRIENGEVPVTVPDTAYLCELYNADAETTSNLRDLASGTEAPEWWESYGEICVPDWFGLYVGMEELASRIDAFVPDIVHGLLQTPEYARAVLGADPWLPADVVEKRLQFRLDRQQKVLARRPRLKVILGAGALELVVGSRRILEEQIEHLERLHADGVAETRVLPWEAGAYPSRGAFAYLHFPEKEDPPTVYTENPGAARYVERPADLQPYERLIKLLNGMSIPIGDYTR